tara:strand:+ start:1701 stop:2174 length:474 start_codon:yes stop_codon:yes gene_type:complete
VSLLDNAIWLVTSVYIPIGYLIGGIILFPLLPFIYPIIGYCFLPFGREIVSTKYLKQFKDYEKSNDKDLDDASGLIRFLANIVWVVTFGWFLALLHIVAGILNVLLIWTIVAIPNIMAHFRMVPVAFMPFGRKVISKELAKILRDIKAEKDLKDIIR